MDTNRLKRFATEARNKIRQGVVNKLLTLGFNAAGEADEFPRQLQGSTLFRGQQLEETFYDKWIALYEAIQKQGLKEIYEEVAYTWFNRFVAIRILQMNGFIDRVLVFDNPDIRVPHIVTEARQGRFPALSASEQLRLRNIITDPTKTYEQFVILITAFCHATPILNRCFGSINDYTELLLPNDILEEGGFVDMLNHSEFITEEDYKTTELLGWLYQFYIAERKDEVFASFKKGKKAEADDIAPATQIFTPNWIVKYMVENTLGRIYLDNNPDSDLQEQMPYLVEKAEGNEEAIYHYDQLEDLRVIDPACGSGHILLEAFDLLYTMYLDEFYSREEAISAIFEHNLVGIDLDTRARQLATFALLLKACQRDDSFLDAHSLPRVLDMPVCNRYTWRDTSGHFDTCYGLASCSKPDELDEAFQLMEQAATLGSVMKFAISEDTRVYLQACVARYEAKPQFDKAFEPLIHGFRIILALTDQYAAVVANPPYMGGGNMNEVLSDYVKKNYVDSKSDLFSVFMTVAENMLATKGKYGMINMQSWMFLSSFEKLRTHILSKLHIDSMLHLGPRTFDELSGEVVQNTAFVISKHEPLEEGGTYYRLIEGNNCREKEALFLSHRCGNEDGNRIYYPNVSQKNFEKIPGSPVGYWVSPKIQEIFASNLALSAVCSPTQGLATADNARFLRLWFEVSQSRIGFGFENAASAARSQKKWFPCNKGGSFRKWYGNQEFLVNWENDGFEIKNFKDSKGKLLSRPQNTKFYFMDAISWSSVSSSLITSFRYFPKGFIFDHAACNIFTDNPIEFLAYLNTNLVREFTNVINPTLNMFNGAIGKLPFLNIKDTNNITNQNISISKQDWDAHETSWDFQKNPLLAINGEDCLNELTWVKEIEKFKTGKEVHILCGGIDIFPQKLEDIIRIYKTKWEHLFYQLHANEEELNRQFIDIYGLQDELTPDVPLDEVTILQQGEISIE